MPPKDEQSQCVEFFQEVVNGGPGWNQYIKSWRHYGVTADSTVPGSRKIKIWMDKTRVRQLFILHVDS